MTTKISSEKVVRFVGELNVKSIPINDLAKECTAIGLENPVVRIIITEKKHTEPKQKKPRKTKEEVPQITFG